MEASVGKRELPWADGSFRRKKGASMARWKLPSENGKSWDSKDLQGQPLQEHARLVAVALEGIARVSKVLVALGLIEAERGGVAGPGGEPEEIGAFRADQDLGPGEQLLADPLPQERT